MASSLVSQYTAIGDLTVGAYWAIREHGLRMPTRRVVAQMARISEATLSRRFAGASADVPMLVQLVSSRGRSYPRSWGPLRWCHWVADGEEEVADVRVWSACEQLAAGCADVAAAVRRVWADERRRLGSDTGADGPTVAALQAVLVGLNRRRMLDPDFTHDEAVTVLELVAATLGLGEPGSRRPG